MANRTIGLATLAASSLFLLIALAPGCQYKNAEELYNLNAQCDTTGTISFMSDIVPIIQDNCYSCHNDANYITLGAGIDLEGHSNFIVWTGNGRLQCAIKHENNCNNMPKGGGKLNECFIAKLDTWVAQGSLNN